MNQVAERGGSSLNTMKEGVRIAMEYLRSIGYNPKDVGGEGRGYDILAGRKRIEVKASTNDRAQIRVDIRGHGPRPTTRLRMNKGKTKASLMRRGLTFDAIIEVASIGRLGGPVVYYYPRGVAERLGDWWIWSTWHLLVKEPERRRYRVRLARGRRKGGGASR